MYITFLLDHNQELKINGSFFGNISTNRICPLIVQNAQLRDIVNVVQSIFTYACIICVFFLVIPGILGNILSLLLLNSKRLEDQYDGIRHYYIIIFSMDIIVIVIAALNGLTDLGYYVMFDKKIWNPILIVPICKFLKYEYLTFTW